MKKRWIFFLTALAAVTLVACNNDDDNDPPLLATVNVTVVNESGLTQAGTTVYMYKDHPVTEETLPGQASRQVVTDAQGVAQFQLNLEDLDIRESQTTLYFATYYLFGDQVYPATAEGVTVRRNDVKHVTLTVFH